MRLITFDLDDTLYLERDYVRSGIRVVWELLSSLGYVGSSEEWKNEWLTDQRPIDRIVSDLGLGLHLKEQLLWAYRLHSPEIELEVEARMILEMLERKGDKVAIITDGRSIGQRQKVKALGLERVNVMISEDYNSKKPDCKRFSRLMDQHKKCEYWYIGDNINKDFIAPNRLGWKTVMIQRDGQLYQSCTASSHDLSPHRIVTGFSELKDLLEAGF